MISVFFPLLLQAATAAVAAPAADAAADADPRLGECLDLASTDPVTAVVRANQWIAGNGGAPAYQCMGLAEAGSGRWDRAEAAFVKAALMAQGAHGPDEANLWMQAGNAALAGGEGATALTHLDRAVATGTLSGKALGEVQLDRARALVSAGRGADAAAALAEAVGLVPQDPLAWLLSATLARRAGDLEKAASDIGFAKALAPEEPAVLLERGNIAALSGDDTAARAEWQRVAEVAPGSSQAEAATRQLAALAEPGEVTAAPAP
ncbi:tetratricopeptide repeat protein [Novosphingopyxis sp.]|uniref:tetratricopeptide repeat protein n=1 Tax=Novosphingopyxis sp. TaxID=2709690 RepID=UPI003B594839